MPIYYYILNVTLHIGHREHLYLNRWFMSTVERKCLKNELVSSMSLFKRFIFITTKQDVGKIKDWDVEIVSVKQIGETNYGEEEG